MNQSVERTHSRIVHTHEPRFFVRLSKKSKLLCEYSTGHIILNTFNVEPENGKKLDTRNFFRIFFHAEWKHYSIV